VFSHTIHNLFQLNNMFAKPNDLSRSLLARFRNAVGLAVFRAPYLASYFRTSKALLNDVLLLKRLSRGHRLRPYRLLRTPKLQLVCHHPSSSESRKRILSYLGKLGLRIRARA
jgi:hypothetical protein